MRYEGFVGPSYTSQSKIAAADELYNLYVEHTEANSGPPDVMYPALGATAYCTLTDTPGRGLYTLNGVTYAVAGGTLFQLPIVSGGSPTVLATGLANPDNGIVYIIGNGDAGSQLMITAGSRLYVYDIKAKALTLIPLFSASFVSYIDGYFVAMDPTASKIYLSNLADGSTWNALNVAQRIDAPDKWLAMVVSHKQAWLFGSQTTAVWYDSGAAGFPFQPNPSVFIPTGIYAPQSLGLINGAPIWLGQDLSGAAIVNYAQGYSYTPQRVSTHAMEFQLSTYASRLDAEALVYQWQGHIFYELTFPTDGVTWVYDATAGSWHKEGPWTGDIYTANVYRGHVFANEAHLFLDRTGPTVWQRSNASNVDTAGNGLRWMRRAPHLVAELRRTIYDRFELFMEVGLGLNGGPDPQAFLRWSDDGGQSWNDPITTSVGSIGSYQTRVIWRKLGQSRDRVFEVYGGDPIPARLLDAYLDVRVGSS